MKRGSNFESDTLGLGFQIGVDLGFGHEAIYCLFRFLPADAAAVGKNPAETSPVTPRREIGATVAAYEGWAPAGGLFAVRFAHDRPRVGRSREPSALKPQKLQPLKRV
jgi:hypothetical protein